MARPQSVGGGRPFRVSTALSRGEMDKFEALRGGMKPADCLRMLINREFARLSSPPNTEWGPNVVPTPRNT